MLKGIIFDLDGTLIDSLPATLEAFNHGIITMGGKQHTPQEIMGYFGPGEDKIFSRILGPEKAQAAYDASREYLNQNLHRISLHSGVGDLLEKIKSAGIPVSIFTGRSWITTEIILNHHRLLDRFVTVIANDHVGNPKPAPEGVLLAASRMRLDPAKTAYVGDTWADIQAAHAACSSSIAATWDLMADLNLLAKENPQHWAKKPLEIWDICGGF